MVVMVTRGHVMVVMVTRDGSELDRSSASFSGVRNVELEGRPPW